MPDDIGNWDDLPHQPLAFFGLTTDYERKDLKRAYGKLIRQYKPETHPEEFQRIRAAYEDLDRALRYRNLDDDQQDQQSQWAGAHRPNVPTDHDSIAPSGPVQGHGDNSEIVESIDPIALAASEPRKAYEHLLNQEHRSPQEFFVLATLSDVIAPDSQRSGFLKWLLRGLKRWPTDPGLISLVTQYFQEELPREKIGNSLLVTAKTLGHPVFYRVTECLWIRYLQHHSFAEFQKLLARCEDDVPQYDSRLRDVFYLYVIRQAVWVAPPEWTDQQLRILEQDSSDWDPGMHEMLEFLIMLAEYRRERIDLQSSPIGPTIDGLLRAYCGGDDPDHITEVVKHAGRLASQSHAVRSSFPITRCERDLGVLLLVLHVFNDLGVMAQPVEHAGDDMARNQLAVAAGNDLRATFGRAQSVIQSHAFIFRLLPMLLGVVLAALLVYWGQSFFLSDRLTKATAKTVSGGVASAWAVLFWFQIYPRWFQPMRQHATQRWLNRYYEKAWRARLFRYVQSVGEPIAEAIDRMAAQAVADNDSDWILAVGQWARSDVGLIILAQSQRFVI